MFQGAANMPRLVQDEAGQIFLDEGGGILTPYTADQAKIYSEGTGTLSGAAKTANKALEASAAGLLGLVSDDYKQQAIQGQKELDVMSQANPLASGAAQFLPQVAIGAATGGAGILPAAAGEAIMGAATNPEAPGTGAVIGGLLGGAGAAVPGVVNYATNKGAQALGKFRPASLPDDALAPGVLRPDATGLADEALPTGASGVPPSPPSASSGTYASQGGIPEPGAPPARMADRVAETIEREAAQEVGQVRVTGDLLLPSELQRYGVGVTPAQGKYLTMTTKESPAAIQAVRASIARDDLMGSIPVIGSGISDVKAGQRAAATNFVNHEFGIPQQAALTDGTVSQRMQEIGGRLDDIATEMGGVHMTPDIRSELENIVEHATGSHQALIKKHVENTLRLADQNGGMLNGNDWQWVRTNLNDTIERGVKRGDDKMISDSAEIMNTLTQAMEGRLPPGLREELRDLRKQYAIGATLHKPGVRDPDGVINPTTFYNRWKSPQGLKWKGKDDVGQFMATMSFLTAKRAGDSGTAPRLLNAVKEGALGLIPGGSMVQQGARALIP